MHLMHLIEIPIDDGDLPAVSISVSTILINPPLHHKLRRGPVLDFLFGARSDLSAGFQLV
jgi:hypothetical protein